MNLVSVGDRLVVRLGPVFLRASEARRGRMSCERCGLHQVIERLDEPDFGRRLEKTAVVSETMWHGASPGCTFRTQMRRLRDSGCYPFQTFDSFKSLKGSAMQASPTSHTTGRHEELGIRCPELGASSEEPFAEHPQW